MTIRIELGFAQDGDRITPQHAAVMNLITEVMRVAIDDWIAWKLYPGPKFAERFEFFGEHAGVDADEWFASKDETPYSFLWCCEVLQINPAKITRALAERVETQLRLVELNARNAARRRQEVSA